MIGYTFYCTDCSLTDNGCVFHKELVNKLTGNQPKGEDL